jgi:hypothetical protein
MSNNNEVKNDVSNSKLSVELIEKIQRSFTFKKEKSTLTTDVDDSSDSDSDDSWLDDEQWYCEKMAQLSGREQVTTSIQQNPNKLKEFLYTRFRSESG